MSVFPIVVELEFEILQDIYSLPPFYGARFSALMRHACHRANINIEDFILGLRPWRQGLRPLLKGDLLGLRLLIAPNQKKSWEELCKVLHFEICGSGSFYLGKTLRLSHAYCSFTGKTISSLNSVNVFFPEALLFSSFSENPTLFPNCMLPRLYALSRASQCILHFDAPLRMTWKMQGGKKLFASKDSFDSDPEILEKLVKKIRYIDYVSNFNESWNIVENTLEWHDMRYSEDRKIALGGLVGSLTIQGKVSLSLAERLILGEYTGIGKNARFGLGYYSLSFSE